MAASITVPSSRPQSVAHHPVNTDPEILNGMQLLFDCTNSPRECVEHRRAIRRFRPRGPVPGGRARNLAQRRASRRADLELVHLHRCANRTVCEARPLLIPGHAAAFAIDRPAGFRTACAELIPSVDDVEGCGQAGEAMCGVPARAGCGRCRSLPQAHRHPARRCRARPKAGGRRQRREGADGCGCRSALGVEAPAAPDEAAARSDGRDAGPVRHLQGGMVRARRSGPQLR